jgi:hypothetical protein
VPISAGIRFASRDAEQSAWVRAADRFTGAGLTDNDRIGL